MNRLHSSENPTPGELGEFQNHKSLAHMCMGSHVPKTHLIHPRGSSTTRGMQMDTPGGTRARPHPAGGGVSQTYPIATHHSHAQRPPAAQQTKDGASTVKPPASRRDALSAAVMPCVRHTSRASSSVRSGARASTDPPPPRSVLASQGNDTRTRDARSAAQQPRARSNEDSNEEDHAPARATSSASVRDEGQPRGRDYPPRLTLRPPSVLVANTGSEF